VSSDPGRPAPSPQPGRDAAPPGAPLLDQEFDSGSLYLLRSAVAAHASAAGLSPDRAYDVMVTAHELAANTVRHGPGRGRLRLWADGRFLHCQVTDTGPPSPQGAGSGPDGTAPWPAEHGHGLWVIGQVATKFSIDRGPGTTATASFAIGPAQRPAPDGSPPQRA
jgi:anti-sigma regulatory factor (Ser/Thr protein kinase)